MNLSVISMYFKHRKRVISLLVLAIFIALSLAGEVQALSNNQQEGGELVVIGQLLDPQGEAVVEASG